jgi:hypothetical protein
LKHPVYIYCKKEYGKFYKGVKELRAEYNSKIYKLWIKQEELR